MARGEKRRYLCFSSSNHRLDTRRGLVGLKHTGKWNNPDHALVLDIGPLAAPPPNTPRST